MRVVKILLIVLAGLALGAGAILVYNGNNIPGAPAPAPGPLFTDTVAAPDRLIIPKINVDAHVKAVGVDEKGDMATPGNATDVAWYNKGPHPGMTGSAVIDGHLNTKYVPKAVFYDLKKLAVGDELQIRTVEGQTMSFKVVRIEEYPENAPAGEIFTKQGSVPYLNLISCAGDWDPVKKTFADRIVVFTERIS